MDVQFRSEEMQTLFMLTEAEIKKIAQVRAEFQRTVFTSRAMAQAQLLTLDAYSEEWDTVTITCKRLAKRLEIEYQKKYANDFYLPMKSYASDTQIYNASLLNHELAVQLQDIEMRKIYIDYLEKQSWRIKSRIESIRLIYGDVQ